MQLNQMYTGHTQMIYILMIIFEIFCVKYNYAYMHDTSLAKLTRLIEQHFHRT